MKGIALVLAVLAATAPGTIFAQSGKTPANATLKDFFGEYVGKGITRKGGRLPDTDRRLPDTHRRLPDTRRLPDACPTPARHSIRRQ